MTKQQQSTKIPRAMQPYFQAITTLTDPFCQQQLNEEYQQLACYTTAALCRKKPSPLLHGRPHSWAAAIIHALGTINFLFDKSTQPFMSAEQLAKAFGLSKSTVGNKAKHIRQLLSMSHFAHQWALPSQLDRSMLWMISVDGFIVDARTLSTDMQRIAYEKGLIPYVKK